MKVKKLLYHLSFKSNIVFVEAVFLSTQQVLPRSPADNNDNNAKNVRQRPRVHRLVVHPLANPTGLQHVSSIEIKFASLDVDAKKYFKVV